MNSSKANNLTAYAWFVTAFNMLVIAWGSVVRATGSGAGCGSHWPQCNGAVIPEFARIETVIEYGHRVSSALAGILVVALVVWCFTRLTPALTRRAAILSLVLVLVEGAVGALLVRLELVAANASVLRAVVIALHLVNTLLLLTCLALTAWSSAHTEMPQPRTRLPNALLLGIGLVAVALLSAAGAVTALGDTLFPAQTLTSGLNSDLDATASFLIRLRVIHPFMAVLTAAYLVVITRRVLDQYHHAPVVAQAARWLYALIALQIVAGMVNVYLLAPVWMQVVHLILADSLWLALLILTLEVRASQAMIATK